MKWIKASERYPKETDDYIYIRHIDTGKRSIIRAKDIRVDIDFSGYCFKSGMYEWLDESPQEGGTVEANPKKFIMQRFGLSKTLFLHNQIEGLTYFDLIEILTEYASQVSATDKARIEELEKEVEELEIDIANQNQSIQDFYKEREKLLSIITEGANDVTKEFVKQGCKSFSDNHKLKQEVERLRKEADKNYKGYKFRDNTDRGETNYI